jgi:N,N'-diacetyllegionaminate synthase
MYPAPSNVANLCAIPALREQLGVPVGFSDHTLSTLVPITAVALGACLVEKHFTLSRALPEGDNDMSAEPKQFQSIVEGIREVEGSLGSGHRSVLPDEASLMGIFRRGIYARKHIEKGQIIEPAMIAVRRPLSSIPADQFDQVVGSRTTVDIKAEEPISVDQLES